MRPNWSMSPFAHVVSEVSAGNVKTPQSEYICEGQFAVIDQGEKLIAGYVNDESRLCKVQLPAIVFGDHTRCFKYVDFPFCMGADGVKILRPKSNIDTKYLYHYFRQLRLPDGGYDRHFKYLRRVDVPLAPLTEQRRIAMILDRADELRARRAAALAQLNELSRAIFYDMFGDPIINLKGWPTRKLSEIGTLDRGVSKHRPRNAPELLGGPYPLIQTGDVANSGGYIRAFTTTYSEIGLQQSKLWPAGTLCITIAANIAKTGILTFDACFPDSVVGFRAREPSTVEYVRNLLSFLQKSLEDSAPESAQKNINLQILRNLEVPFPPSTLQCEFARRIDAVEEHKVKHRAAAAELDALFVSLQHCAFRGEL